MAKNLLVIPLLVVMVAGCGVGRQAAQGSDDFARALRGEADNLDDLGRSQWVPPTFLRALGSRRTTSRVKRRGLLNPSRRSLSRNDGKSSTSPASTSTLIPRTVRRKRPRSSFN